jgi:hypothetical protein
VPIYVYRLQDGREVEEFFHTWREAPQELLVGGEVARRVPARFATHFANAELRAAAKQGVVPMEPGMKEAAARARKQIEQKQTRERHEVIAKTFNELGVDFSL